MKIAVFSDVHDNLERWREAAEIIDVENIKVGICCGDVGDLQTLEGIAKPFEKLYLVLGNLDFKLKYFLDSRRSLSDEEIPASAGMTEMGGNDPTSPRLRGTSKTGLFPENVEWFGDIGEFTLQRVAPSAGGEERKIAIVHYDYKAKDLAESGKYDIVFYGHTHTPWEEKVGKTHLLNPGEISGQFSKATFAIYDLKKMKAELKILR